MQMAGRGPPGGGRGGVPPKDQAQTEESELKIVFTKEPFIPPAPPQKIQKIEFVISSPEEISKVGDILIHESKLYRMPERQPHPGGVLDTRLGTSSKQGVCQTCDQKLSDCAGHFGYIRLHLPLFHIGYLQTTIQTLQAICKTCSRVLLGLEDRKVFMKRMRNPRLDHIAKKAVFKKLLHKCKLVKMCPYCGGENGTVKKIGGMYKILHDKYKGKADYLAKEDFGSAIVYNDNIEKLLPRITDDLNALRVFHLFERIPDEDLDLLDLATRPENLLIWNIPVPPVCIRPSVEMEGIGSNEDDISMRLSQIIEYNTRLRVGLEQGLAASSLVDIWDAMQIELMVVINSDVPGLSPQLQPQRKVRGYVQRLKGKQGRFRGNLSGKRVDFSGRTVISPDPNLGVHEVAVPLHVAVTMTFPQRVNQYNLEDLQARVLNGQAVHPGANLVVKQDGVRFMLKHADRRKIARELQPGDIVERHLKDGDVVLFNRQPSLHRISIMAHRAKVRPWRTLRFNECVCNPYNADFDGDEMNLHLPQTEEARTEALLLMGTVNNLCTPKSGEVMICATQDFLTCAFLLTSRDTYFTRAQFGLLCCYMMNASQQVDLPHPAILKPVELWTGKQLFNVLVRPNGKSRVFLNLEIAEKTYSKKDKEMCPNDGYVRFYNSELISGRLGKVVLGGNKGGLFGVLNNDFKPQAAAECMNRLAKLSARFMGEKGFTIGIDDVTPAPSLQQSNREKMEASYRQCDEFIEQFSKGQLPPDPGMNDEETLESRVKGVLNEIRTEAGKLCMSSLHYHNSPLIMSLCGSKGSPINIAQMVACVGQQSVNGKRCFNGFPNRTLPHFPRGDKTPQGKGFVANSFYSGLTPTEFFFHTMAGREGLVDTAVKTAETGYMSRRLMKALEDLYAHYDFTVRDASSCIVQFKYGDDALDPPAMEGKQGEAIDFNRLISRVRLLSKRGNLRDDQGRWTVPLPGEMEGMIEEVFRRPEFQSKTEQWCSGAFKRGMEAFLSGLLTEYKQARERLGLLECERGEPIQEYLACSAGLTRREFGRFVRQVMARYETKRIDPGSTVGAVGAQSIGEPGTQMTLKTFHFAGVASMQVTQGVPRIKEIINASKTISTPIMDVPLEINDSIVFARLIKGRLERTMLGEIAYHIKTVLKSSDAFISIVLDMEAINRLQLDLDAYTVRDSILATPKIKVKEERVYVESAKHVVVYPTMEDGKELVVELLRLEAALPKVIVAGIPTIERSVIHEEKGKGPDGKSVYKLLAEGTELLAVMGVAGVVGNQCVTNHIMETEKCLGIEAARTKIINEIEGTMGAFGMQVDRRHTMLLADCMTYKGEVLGITRVGITKMKDSVLHAASFEKTTDHLFDAAVHGRVDFINGVSESIIMGIPMPTGTGMFKILYNQEEENTALPKRVAPLLTAR